MNEVLNNYLSDGYILCQNLLSKKENSSLEMNFTKNMKMLLKKKVCNYFCMTLKILF